MAIALHQALGWPIRTLTAYRDKTARQPHPAHSWVQAPDGRAFDAKGFRSEDEILGDMLANKSQVSVDSARICTSRNDADYTSFLFRLADGGPEFELWYRKKLDEIIPEASEAIRNYLEPRYAPSSLAPGMRAFSVRYQPDGITCGPSALGAVMDLLCDDAPSTRVISELCGTNPYTGTTDVAMKRGLEALGMAYDHPASSTRNEVGFLDAQLDAGNVVLLRTMSSGCKHWVTAYGRDDEGYRIGCPVGGELTWSAAKLNSAWSARDRDCMVVSRNPADHPDLRTTNVQLLETAEPSL
jgi:hypothetical protein